MIHLLDTDTFILLVRGSRVRRPRGEKERMLKDAARNISRHVGAAIDAGHPIGMSAITLAELEYGARKSSNYEMNREAERQSMAPFERFAFDPVDCVRHYGIVRSHLESKGQAIGPLDMLIAAHALALGATLVTNNTKEFKRVKDLKVENWSA